MSKLIYSKNGSATTKSIRSASPMLQAIWDRSHMFGANIVRVRAEKVRHGNSTGKTFDYGVNGKQFNNGVSIIPDTNLVSVSVSLRQEESNNT